MADETKVDPLRAALESLAKEWEDEAARRERDSTRRHGSEAQALRRGAAFERAHAARLRATLSAVAAPAPDPQGWEEIERLVSRLGKEWFEYGVACGVGLATVANPHAVEAALLRALRASVSGAPVERERLEEAIKRAAPRCVHVEHGQRICVGCAAVAAAREVARLPDGTFPSVPGSDDGARDAGLTEDQIRAALEQGSRDADAAEPGLRATFDPKPAPAGTRDAGEGTET